MPNSLFIFYQTQIKPCQLLLTILYSIILNNKMMYDQKDQILMRKILKRWSTITHNSDYKLNMIIEFRIHQHKYIEDLIYQQKLYSEIMINELQLEEEWVNAIYVNWNCWIPLCKDAVLKLQTIKNNWDTRKSEVADTFSTMLIFSRVNYFEYYQKLTTIIKALKRMENQFVNKDKIRKIFQHLFIPFDRLLEYGKFIRKYIDCISKCQYSQQYFKMQQVKGLYNEIHITLQGCEQFLLDRNGEFIKEMFKYLQRRRKEERETKEEEERRRHKKRQKSKQSKSKIKDKSKIKSLDINFQQLQKQKQKQNGKGSKQLNRATLPSNFYSSIIDQGQEQYYGVPVFFSFNCVSYKGRGRVIVTCEYVILVKDEKNNIKEIKHLQLDQLSFMRIYPQTVFYKHMVYICGKDYGIHLQMENKEDKLMLQRLINLKVQYLSIRKLPNMFIDRNNKIWYNFKVRAHVQAIQLRNKVVTVRLQLTQYNMVQYLRIPLKVFISLQDYIFRVHQHIKIRKFSKYNLNEADPKHKLQNQCFVAAQFMNSLFRSQQFRTNPNYIAHKLGIRQSVWQLLTYNQKCSCYYCQVEPQPKSSQIVTLFKSLIDNSDDNRMSISILNNNLQDKHKNEICVFYMLRLQNNYMYYRQKKVLDSFMEDKLQVINNQLWKQFIFNQPLSTDEVSYFFCEISVKKQPFKAQNIFKHETVRDVIKRIPFPKLGYLFANVVGKEKDVSFILNDEERFGSALQGIRSEYINNKVVLQYRQVYSIDSTVKERISQITSIEVSSCIMSSRRAQGGNSLEFGVRFLQVKSQQLQYINGTIKIGWQGIRLQFGEFNEIIKYSLFECSVFSSIIYFKFDEQIIKMQCSVPFTIYKIIKNYQRITHYVGLKNRITHI